ncbi:cell division protein SepF [Peptococcaceae bacterium 1198_IL3148]
MAKLADKFLGMLGFELVEEDEPQEIMPAMKKEEKVETKNSWFSSKTQEREEERRPKLTSVPTNTYNTKMVILKPTSYDQVQNAANHLGDNHSVVVDLTEMSIEQAQRVLDYLSGVVFAINGKASRVGTGIFLFVPANVSIEGALDDFMFTQNKEVTKETVEDEGFTSLLKAVNN